MAATTATASSVSSLILNARASSSICTLAKPTSLFFAIPSSSSLKLSCLRSSVPTPSSRFVRRVAVSNEFDQEEGYEPSFSPDLKVFVGNLPFSADSAQLAGLFETAGNVEMVEVIYDKITGRSRGFGFVTMSSAQEVESAVQQLNGYELDGRALRVNSGPAPPPREREFSRESPFGRGSRVGGGYGGSGGGGGGSRDDGGNRVYVGNLSWGVDNSALENLFSEQGNVVEARVVYDRDSGRSRGFGFVTFSSADDMNTAIDSLNGAELDGRQIRVSVAEARQRRQF